jgi:zinc and cadmium transporter
MNFLPTVLSAIIAFVATISAGLFIKKFKSNIGIICAFSAGFFISLVLFDLLPDVLALAPKAQISIDQLFLSGIAGFVFLFALNFGFSRFHIKNHTMTKTSHPRIGLIATLEFCSHGFLEGLAIGLSFQIQFSLGVVVAIAVVSHDFCDGISTLTLMLNSG